VSNNSLRKEKDPDLVRLSTRSPEREGIPSKIPASEAGVAAGGLCGRRGGCGREEGDGREEGLPHHWKTYEHLHWSLRPHYVWLFVSFVHVVVHISQERLKITDRVSVICPHDRKGLTFVGPVAVGGHSARHG
jgi:hypothetical protein